MSFVRPVLRWTSILLLWSVVAACLAVTIVPRYLDRIYYHGPDSGHYDGERFFNPDGEDTVRVPGNRRGGRAGFLWRQATGADGRPEWPDRVAVHKDMPPARVDGGAMRATWVGHATVLVQANGLNILTDPIWSEVAGPFGLAGPRRTAPPAIDFDKLPKIDLVLVSHNHYDHLDLPTLKQLWARDKPAIITSLGNDTILRSAGIEAYGLDWGQAGTLTDKGLEVENGLPRCDPVAACPGDRATVIVNRNHHWGSRWFTDRNRALWSSFVVTLPGGNLFFAGDTGAGDYKWADQAASYGPIRLAILPIGAFRFQEGEMRTGSHIGPGEAIKLWNRMGRPTTLPMHWGTFRLSWEGYWTPPRMLRAIQACAGETSGRFAPQSLGRAWDIPTLAAAPPPVSDARVDACMKDPAVTALR
ncbi:Zn-dependent hydrolase [Sphingomonas koreensis]|jgi:L-ascorbate metabolism protein UlaG (beta-lactamase superfamily)|uniref:Zn-dependent hydrolase n=1 Tax=Sphingomonas koreensis TaxID=93064 RepID=A0A1L6JEM1_9SPHN|nr:MBL fold metallo-hydrolase [Sphingomonas koreensis]APR54363.1 Zn-dependent hydrolase [Sphingomonas koreensis]RSU18426.1 Zn-dependent hydrolase [Sphingomonas koreensis]RSU19188.1 Zn-dependent hydrolase [Sphingomonas koreensis]RSU20829.1 Zn-dependent hydrolase [Sphingomonas koreensis]RSU33276.1 Zn-dependent hydrolase [Sphingomonas koreensis]